MIKELIDHIKTKQAIYYGLIATKSIDKRDHRLIAKLLFSSGIDINEIINLKWENLTVIENILLINYKDKTRLAIASKDFVQDLLKADKCDGFIFENCQDMSKELILKNLNNTLLLNSARLDFEIGVDCNWLRDNFEKTIYVPSHVEELYKKYILDKTPICNKELSKKDFKKLLEIKSLI